jgi:hypothetical protein
MKPTSVVVVCAALLLAGAVGVPAKPVTFGLQGGIDLAQFKYDPEVTGNGIDRLMGFGGGLTLGFAITPALGFDVDGMYMLKGTRFEGPVEGVGTVKTDTKLSYAIASPVLRLRMPGRSLAPYVLGGGEVGFLMSAKQKTSVTGGLDDSEHETDIKDQLEDLDYGFVVGAGLEIPNSSGGGLFLEARYARGLADIGKDGDGTAKADDTGTKIMNDAVYFLAGIRF